MFRFESTRVYGMQMKGVMIRRQTNKRKEHFEIELVENEREEAKYTYFFISYFSL